MLVTKEATGQKPWLRRRWIPPSITDFNRVRLEFVGHYREMLENPVTAPAWLDVGRNSSDRSDLSAAGVEKRSPALPGALPTRATTVAETSPMVFAGSPDVTASSRRPPSWAPLFGSRLGWRGQSFPVMYDKMPDKNAIVFATNTKRPAFPRPSGGKKHPPSRCMAIAQSIRGAAGGLRRDDKDLVKAAKGIAEGNILFR
ncbi:cellulose biosynthesis cyclic di-GMP-binding regulatory protein BcsB [Shigella flexneri]